jgi:hypothetical protein
MTEEANSHLSGTQAELPINDPLSWLDARRAPAFDVKRFQDRIDDIVGTNRTGKSIIRLVWSWDSWFPAFGRKHQRYNFLTLEWDGKLIDVSVPRFAIEERIEPEQFIPSWDAARYQSQPGTEEVLDRGDPPNEWWRTLWVVADHETSPVQGHGSCCKRAEALERACWGYYRNPSEYDLNEIRRIHQLKLRDDQFTQNPYEPLSQREMERSMKSAFDIKEKRKEQKQAELKQRTDDHFKTHLHRLQTSDPKVLRSGKFHFLDENYKKANGVYTLKES